MATPASSRPLPALVPASGAAEPPAKADAKPRAETAEERRRRLDAIFEDVVESNRDFLIALAKR